MPGVIDPPSEPPNAHAREAAARRDDADTDAVAGGLTKRVHLSPPAHEAYLPANKVNNIKILLDLDRFPV